MSRIVKLYIWALVFDDLKHPNEIDLLKISCAFYITSFITRLINLYESKLYCVTPTNAEHHLHCVVSDGTVHALTLESIAKEMRLL